MLINEGLPAHVIDMAKRDVTLDGRTVGVLGMGFKAEIDDPRDSLFIGAPHKAYKRLPLAAHQRLFDVWNHVERKAPSKKAE